MKTFVRKLKCIWFVFKLQSKETSVSSILKLFLMRVYLQLELREVSILASSQNSVVEYNAMGSFARWPLNGDVGWVSFLGKFLETSPFRVLSQTVYQLRVPWLSFDRLQWQFDYWKDSSTVFWCQVIRSQFLHRLDHPFVMHQSRTSSRWIQLNYPIQPHSMKRLDCPKPHRSRMNWTSLLNSTLLIASNHFWSLSFLLHPISMKSISVLYHQLPPFPQICIAFEPSVWNFSLISFSDCCFCPKRKEIFNN